MAKKRAQPESLPLEDLYRLGDKRAYDLLKELLLSQGFRFIRDNKTYNLGSVDSLLWQVMDKDLKNDPYTGVPFNAYDIAHHGMHFLVADRYGPDYMGMPKTTLLSEALAGCCELYFEGSAMAQTGSLKGNRVSALYVQNSRNLRKPFLKQLNKALENPFLSYQALVQDHLKISLAIMEYCLSANQGRRISPGQVRKKLRSVGLAVFLAQKPFASFVLYAMTFCGGLSSQKDSKAYEECLGLLLSSSSMLEFIKAMTKSQTRAHPLKLAA